MAKRSDIPPEPLVRVADIAARLNSDVEVVARRVKSDLVSDWDNTLAVRWSVAKTTFEQLAAEKAEHDRQQIAALDAQLDAERDGRMAPYSRWLAACERGDGLVGTQATVPDGPEPAAWAKEGE